MAITHRRLRRVDILTVSGPLQAAVAAELDTKFQQLVAERRVRLVLDLAASEYTSSAGLRTLIEARRLAQKTRAQGGGKGDLRLANAGSLVRATLAHTGFSTYFPIYDELVEAVASY